MKALTLWRPWPYAIFHLPPGVAKRVENRSWVPPLGLIGHRIAIHAGKVMDQEAGAFIKRRAVTAGHREHLFSMDGPARDEGIIGTATLLGVLGEDYGSSGGVIAGSRGALSSAQIMPWFFGPYGWLLDDVRALPEPIPCKGRQGLWDVPAELVGRLA